MKVCLGALFFVQLAMAQLPSVPCIQPPAPAPPRAPQAPANGQARAGFVPRAQTPQTADDIAEMAKLKDSSGMDIRRRRWRLFDGPGLSDRAGTCEAGGRPRG